MVPVGALQQSRVSKNVFVNPLRQANISSCLQASTANGILDRDQPIQWQVLPNAPLVGSTAVSHSGLLFAIGGEQEIDKGSTAIYYYQTVSGQWIKAGSLPSERKECGCTVLLSGELLIAGGFIIPFMEQVDVAKIV